MEGLSPNRSMNLTMRTTPSTNGSISVSSRRSSRNTSIGSKVFSDYEDNDTSIIDENMEPNKSPKRLSNRSINKGRLSLESSTILELTEEVSNTITIVDNDNNNEHRQTLKSLVFSASSKSKQQHKGKSKSVNNSMNKSINSEIATYDNENNENYNEEVNEEENEEENNVSLADIINKSVVSSTDGSPEVYKNYYAVLAGTPSVDMSTFSLADIQSESGVSTGDKRSWSNRSPGLNVTDDKTTSFNFKESDGRRATADPADLATLIDDINNESVNITNESNLETSQKMDSVSTLSLIHISEPTRPY